MARRLSLLAVAFATATFGLAVAFAGETGDPYFPGVGATTYDVLIYDVGIRYERSSRRIRATTAITLQTKGELDSVALDFEGLRVTGAKVNGASAEFRRSGTKLIVTTPSTAAGEQLVVEVAYRGKPGRHRDPDGSFEGWFETPDGAFAVGEPLGTQTWVPVNNSLLDKASWTFRLNVPKPLHAVANGRLLSKASSGSRTTWTWHAEEPMVPYLALIQIGRGKVVRTTAAGVPAWTAISPRAEQKQSKRVLRKLPKVIRFLAGLWGPYPFDSAGSIVDPSNIGYALETQTRPIYSTTPDLSTVVHETAHQWFGNSVTPQRWEHVWLNEGFAAWNEWYWAEKHGGPSARSTMRKYLRSDNRQIFSPPPGRPGGAANLFAESVYLRGGMTLQALRERIGTKQFLGLLRQWVQQNRYANASTRDFIDLAESVSGRQLDDFFQRWLFKRGKP